MKKRFKNTLLLLFLFMSINSFGQQPPIDVTFKWEGEGKARVACTNKKDAPLIIRIAFNNPNTLNADVSLPFVTTVLAGRSTSFSVKPSFGSADYSYKTKYLWGCKDSTAQLDYPYLLPIASGKETTIGGLYNFNERHKIKKTGVPARDYYALSFKTESGDTIYASRRGSVFRVKDDVDLKYENYSMASNDNEIYITHSDCSIARYLVLNEIFVKEGDWVEAGQPIAITGGEKYKSGTHVRFSVYYAYKCLDCEGDNEDWYGYAYVKPKFYLRGGAVEQLETGNKYVSEHTEEMIIREMSKRELKKWNKKNKK